MLEGWNVPTRGEVRGQKRTFSNAKTTLHNYITAGQTIAYLSGHLSHNLRHTPASVPTSNIPTVQPSNIEQGSNTPMSNTIEERKCRRCGVGFTAEVHRPRCGPCTAAGALDRAGAHAHQQRRNSGKGKLSTGRARPRRGQPRDNPGGCNRGRSKPNR